MVSGARLLDRCAAVESLAPPTDASADVGRGEARRDFLGVSRSEQVAAPIDANVGRKITTL